MIREYLVNIKNTNPFLFYLWSLNQKRKGILNLKSLSDEEAIIKLYKNYCGKIPDLHNPTTFGEKLQWLKLNYHNPLQTICADKYEVRSYLEKKGYGNLLNNAIGCYEDIKEFDVKSLPNKFVIKATHGSGWNLICNDKDKINWFIWRKIIKVWLTNNIFWPGREWPYKNMKPRILVEEFLIDESGQLMDFKLFCFNGKAKFVQANKGRDTLNHAQNFYDLNWDILPFGKDLKPRPDIIIPPPTKLKEMIEIAEDLSKDFPFVRVDFYEVQGKIIFGELTFYPKSGLPDFTPPEYDKILGDYIFLPNPIH
jgi:hypothetical protein